MVLIKIFYLLIHQKVPGERKKCRMEREERRCYRAFAVKDLVIPINTFKVIKLYYTELKYQSGLARTTYSLSPSL